MEVVLCTQERGFYFGEAAIIGNTTTTATVRAKTGCAIYALRSVELQQLTTEMPEVKESLLQTVSHRLKQNLLAIPFFSQLRNALESKKTFKVLGAFDLLSTLFELESFGSKETLFNEGDLGQKFYVICEGCIRISSHDSDGNDFMLSMLKKNDVFGEIALVEHTKRTATARAFEPSLVLSITKEKFDKLFEVFPAFKDIMMPHIAHRTANTLKRVKVFGKLSNEKMETLGGLMEFRDFDAGEVIEHEGSYNAGLYIIIWGTVNAITTKEGEAKPKILSVMSEGGVMGEMALLTGTPRSATLVAVTSCLCLHLSAEKFRRFLPFAPELMDDLIFTAKTRRKNSIEINAEASLQIPNIDGDVANKLYLYSLLRNRSEDDERAEMEKTQKTAAQGDSLKSLLDQNKEMKQLNENKRQRLLELKERVRSMTKNLVPGNNSTISSLPVSSMSSDVPEDGNNGSPLPSMKTLQRRNSWTSNTDMEQYRLDLSRILNSSTKLQAAPSIESLTSFVNDENSRRGRIITETINIKMDVVEETGKTSPSKNLGKHFETYSAAVSTKQMEINASEDAEETLESHRSHRSTSGSRPSSKSSRRNSGSREAA